MENEREVDEVTKNLLPVVIRIATIAQNAVTEMANMATDNAPTYIAVTKTKNRAKNPPAAAKDISNDMTMAFMVAARKKSINTSNPVKATKATVPTCSSKEKQIIQTFKTKDIFILS